MKIYSVVIEDFVVIHYLCENELELQQAKDFSSLQEEEVEFDIGWLGDNIEYYACLRIFNKL